MSKFSVYVLCTRNEKAFLKFDENQHDSYNNFRLDSDASQASEVYRKEEADRLADQLGLNVREKLITFKEVN